MATSFRTLWTVPGSTRHPPDVVRDEPIRDLVVHPVEAVRPSSAPACLTSRLHPSLESAPRGHCRGVHPPLVWYLVSLPPGWRTSCSSTEFPRGAPSSEWASAGSSSWRSSAPPNSSPDISLIRRPVASDRSAPPSEGDNCGPEPSCARASPSDCTSGPAVASWPPTQCPASVSGKLGSSARRSQWWFSSCARAR